MESFNVSVTPQLYFGAGKISMLPTLARGYGKHVLLITGAKSFQQSPYGNTVLTALETSSLTIHQAVIDREPTPAMIDSIVNQFSSTSLGVVIAIGGGSVLDAGKAVAAMLPLGEPVKDYLEGVGTKSHPGSKVPFIAVPTTAGTGSEATKNAVLSETGEHGYKKSLRHNNFVPDVALIDPSLTVSCPPAVTAASGMDAFTQLLESYLSTSANAVTDALALEGLQRISRSLKTAYATGDNVEARTDMALASYLSGITLANAGLGLVHGFASAVGGYFEIAHGVICSSLMHAANTMTVKQLRAHGDPKRALVKYASVGKLFAGSEGKSQDFYVDFLLDLIGRWTSDMNIPDLSHGGVKPSDISKIIEQSDNKNNPFVHSKEDMHAILLSAIRV